MAQFKNDTIRTLVREQYRKVAILESFGYCGTVANCCSALPLDLKSTLMECAYSHTDITQIPDGANMGLGCGNPLRIASLTIGETVLDLGCGGGFDCFLAALEVGESGVVIGVDMTPEMVSRARANAGKEKYKNVEFRLGEIEYLPVANEVVDVIISNCVINLSPEKSRVFNESFRVLKPGGRLTISDVVALVVLPDEFKNDVRKYSACVSGVSLIDDIEMMLIKAGFVEIEIKPKNENKKNIQKWMPTSKLEDYIVSATIKALKPKKNYKKSSVEISA